MQIIVTTSRKCANSSHAIDDAKALAKYLNGDYLERHDSNTTLASLLKIAPIVVIVEQDRLIAHNTQGKKLFFHPGMSLHKIRGIVSGEKDPIVTATDLKSGDSVLDCTLGLANDALLFSYIAGKSGLVVGVESSKLIASLALRGLRDYRFPIADLQDAAHRIRIIAGDSCEILTYLPDNSFDVVYFDPFFTDTILESANMQQLRAFGDHRRVSRAAIEQALRVARKRVVMKDRNSNNDLQYLGFSEAEGRGSVVYGVIRK